MLRKKKIVKRAASKAKGQSTVEYIILVAAVIAALLFFLPNFRQSVEDTMEKGTNGMLNMAVRLESSRPVSP